MGGFSVLSLAGNALLLSKPAAAPDEVTPPKVLPLSGLQLTPLATHVWSVLEVTSLLKVVLRLWNGLFHCRRHNQYELGAIPPQVIRGHLVVVGFWQRPPGVG